MRTKTAVSTAALLAALALAGCGSSTTTRTVTVTGQPSHATVIAAPAVPGQTIATNQAFAAACTQGEADANTFVTDSQTLMNDLSAGLDTTSDSSTVSVDTQQFVSDLQAMNVARGNSDLQTAGLAAEADQMANNGANLSQQTTNQSAAEMAAVNAACH